VSTTGGFVHRLRVRFGECDPQGVVFNANYLLYFDVAITELWRERLGGYAEMIDRGVDVMLVQSNIGYRRPAKADDEIDVRLRVVSLGTTSMTLGATVERDDELLAEAELHYVFLDAASFTKTEIPPEIRAALSAGGAGT
jgi:acyl-CoA thioester hydrolase